MDPSSSGTPRTPPGPAEFAASRQDPADLEIEIRALRDWWRHFADAPNAITFFAKLIWCTCADELSCCTRRVEENAMHYHKRQQAPWDIAL